MTMTDTQAQEASRLLDMYGPEDLHEDLVPFIRHRNGPFGPVLKHPLVVSVGYTPILNKVLNSQYEAKKRAVAEAMGSGRWWTVVFMHERPFRVDAFLRLRDRLSDDEYWTLLGAVWEDTENLHEWGDRTIRSLWHPRPDRGPHDLVMEDDERAALAALPRVIDAYRGYDRRNSRGWSWTTDRAKAEWFARRFATLSGSRPRLATATVLREEVLAHFTGRGESEIVLDPARLGRVTTRALAPVRAPTAMDVFSDDLRAAAGRKD